MFGKILRFVSRKPRKAETEWRLNHYGEPWPNDVWQDGGYYYSESIDSLQRTLDADAKEFSRECDIRWLKYAAEHFK